MVAWFLITIVLTIAGLPAPKAFFHCDGVYGWGLDDAEDSPTDTVQADSRGHVIFEIIGPGDYTCRIRSMDGHYTWSGHMMVRHDREKIELDLERP